MTDIYALVSPAPPALVRNEPAFSRKQMILGGIAVLVVLINLAALMLYFCVKRGFRGLFDSLYWRRKGKICTNRFFFFFLNAVFVVLVGELGSCCLCYKN